VINAKGKGGCVMESEKKLSREELLLKKRKEIDEQLKKLKASDNAKTKKRDTTRKMIVGEVVIAHATKDAVFANLLRKVLQEAVTEQRHLDMISDLINDVSIEEKTAIDSSIEEIMIEDDTTVQSGFKP
jgi:hypothetical protein